MKGVVLTAVLVWFMTLVGASQKTESYTAASGMVYSVGDTVTLGVGSEPDGKFKWIYSGITRSIFANLAEKADYDPRLPEFFQGTPVVINKIIANAKEVFFLFDSEVSGGFVIDIEKASAVCEVAYCRPNGFLTQQEYEKLILMYQAVAKEQITEEKFESLRSELLGSSTLK